MDAREELIPHWENFIIREPLESAKRNEGAPEGFKWGSTITTTRVQWLWKPYIPLGKLTIIEGDPGVGKTFVATGIAAGVSRGRLPDGAVIAPGNSLIISEGDADDTIVPRFEDAGGDATRLLTYERNAINIASDKGLNLLRDAIVYGNLRLVVLDPLVSMSGGRDTNKYEEAYEIMDRLRTVAKEQMVAVVVVRHLNKTGHSNPAYRGIGSVGWGGATDSILLATRDDTTGERALAHHKSRHAPLGDPIGFVIDEHGFGWTKTNLTNADLLGVSNPKEWSAERAIPGLLANGPLHSSELVQLVAEVTGAGDRTIQQARANLKKAGIITTWRDPQGRWWWGLPEHEPGSQVSREDLI